MYIYNVYIYIEIVMISYHVHVYTYIHTYTHTYTHTYILFFLLPAQRVRRRSQHKFMPAPSVKAQNPDRFPSCTSVHSWHDIGPGRTHLAARRDWNPVHAVGPKRKGPELYSWPEDTLLRIQ